MKKISIVLLAIAFIFGCGKSPDPNIESPDEKTGFGLEEFPSWVIDPQIDGGIAASECIPFSGNISIDKAQITTQGRATLSKQIDVRVSVLDKTYIDRTDAAGKIVAGSSFSSVSKQLSDQYLSGTRLAKLSRILVNGQQNLCGMVVLNPAETNSIFKEILANSNREVTAEDESILSQEFKAHRAQESLDKELNQ